MQWDLHSDRAIYVQIIEQIKLRIVSGVYPAGARLPSVRDMAAEAAVNPNTMQRALSELERDGLLVTDRTSGRFVVDDAQKIRAAKCGIAEEVVREFITKMESIGFTRDEIRANVEAQLKEATT